MGSHRGEPDLPPGPARDLVDLYRALPARSRMSNAAIAKAACLSAGYVSEVLRGLKAPSPDAAERIAAALRASADTRGTARLHAEKLAELHRYQRRTARAAPPPPVTSDGSAANSAVTSRPSAPAVEKGIDLVTETPRFLTEAFPLRTPDVRTLLGQGPSELLAAGSRVVPFVGRVTELSALSQWRDRPGRLAVMLVHAAGGAGKTRLAARFAEESASAGWAVAQARHFTDPRPSSSPAPSRAAVGRPRGLLVVVDYAERWPRLDLERLLQDRLMQQDVPTRLLLLARPAGYWWKTLANPLRKLGAVAERMPLGALAETPAQRKVVFDGARDRFAELLDATAFSGLRPPGSLADDAYDLVLTLHMAALVAVDAHVRGTAPPSDPGGLSGYLLEREYDHWQTLKDIGRISVSTATMGRLTAVATLTRALPTASAVRTLISVGLAANPVEAQHLLDDHAICYPPTTAGTVLEPLLPDRLGEDFLADLLPDLHEATERHGDAWAADLPGKLLAPDGDEPEPAVHASAVLTVLVETGRRSKHVRRDHVFPLLRRSPRLALETDGATLVTLAGYADIGVLQALSAALPDGRNVDLDGGIAAFTRRLTDFALASEPDAAARADLQDTLAERMSNAGLFEEALAASLDAIEARRLLAADSPGTHQPALGYSLGNAGIDLWNLGRHEEACVAVRESVEIFQSLAAADPAAWEDDHAAQLSNLAGTLLGLKRYEEALPPARQATEVYQRLSAARPGKYEVELGTCWRNAAVILSGLRRHTGALEAATEAVAVYRRLASAKPAAHDPDLAEALRSLGNRLSNGSRPEEALAVTEEAVQIFERLSTANPKAFAVSLARALINLGNRHSNLGDHAQALAARERAAQILEELSEVDPEAHEPMLASVLNGVAAELQRLDRPREARQALGESLTLYLRLNAADPARYAETLGVVQARLADLDRHDPAP
ncbi:tetratricopeptide repeat protein [Streptomyces caniscabiei]|uniref:tetratricopeptide repeat protein n=1 Tax=Streptomyces caniscabiei TaxID=2746961 RepID=UPI000A3B8724|nr:tetratricopeptide repeat protein [Streptomyces caniscabiei]